MIIHAKLHDEKKAIFFLKRKYRGRQIRKPANKKVKGLAIKCVYISWH